MQITQNGLYTAWVTGLISQPGYVVILLKELVMVSPYGDLGIFHGGAKQRKLYISQEPTDTLGTPLPISLKWLECSHKEMWDLKVNLSLSLSGLVSWCLLCHSHGHCYSLRCHSARAISHGLSSN